MFKVTKERCSECLFSKEKIVSDRRRSQVLKECVRKDTHFICHKATLRGEEVCCAGFHEAYPHGGQLHRIAQRLNAIVRVEVE